MIFLLHHMISCLVFKFLQLLREIPVKYWFILLSSLRKVHRFLKNKLVCIYFCVMPGRFVNRCVFQHWILIFLWKFIRLKNSIGFFRFTSDIWFWIDHLLYISWGYDIVLWFNSEWQNYPWVEIWFLSVKLMCEAPKPALLLWAASSTTWLSSVRLSFSFIKPETWCFPHNHWLWYSHLTPMQRPSDDFPLGFGVCYQVSRKSFPSTGWSTPFPPASRVGQVLQTWTFWWPPQHLLLLMFSFARGKEIGSPVQVFSYKCQIEGGNHLSQLSGHAHSARDAAGLHCGHRQWSQWQMQQWDRNI